MTNHRVVTFWDGKFPLHYIHHISLKSFLANGHDVTIFTLANPDEFEAPEGAKVVSVFEVFPQFEGRFERFTFAQIADLLRPHLIKKFDAVWVDTDVVSIRPLLSSYNYLFSSEGTNIINDPSEGNLNNAVLYFPPDSPTLDVLCDFSNTVLGVHQSEDPRVMHYLMVVRTHRFLRYGPPALTRFAYQTHEIIHQRHPSELSPIHFNFSDCYWDPLVDVEARFNENTLTTHIWDSQIRPGWYRRTPLEGSYLDKLAKRLDVNPEHYRRKKQFAESA